MAAFAELGARSNFSFLDGASHPEELVQTAQALGLAGLGICDLNSLAGVVRGHVAAKVASLPFRVGCRLQLDDSSEWLAWPGSRAAYGRLTALLSRGRMHAPKGECRISRAAMLAAAEGWVLAAIPPARADAAWAAQLRRDAATLRDRLALPLLLTASCVFRGADRHRLDVLAGLAAQTGTRLLAAGDVRYHHPDRRRLADVLTAIRLRTTVDALGYAAEANAERHLKPLAEMARLFADHPDALANSLAALEASAGFSLDQLRYEYPDEVLEPGRSPHDTLADRVATATAARWPGGTPPDIAGRIAHELRLIEELGYAPYFLTVHDLVRFAREERGILCQGRGSAANSVVCFCTWRHRGRSHAKHDLLFERFVSARSRDEPPDIDVDFEHERREEVMQYLYDGNMAAIAAALTATVIRPIGPEGRHPRSRRRCSACPTT